METLDTSTELQQYDFQALQQPSQLNTELLQQIDNNIKGQSWIYSYQCITMIRQIHKYYPQHISDMICKYGNVILELLGSGKTQLIKNILRLLREIFLMGKSVCVESSVSLFLPIIIKKSSTAIGHIKQGTQQVLRVLTANCGYNVTFLISAELTTEKNAHIAQISIQMLAALIQNIGSSLLELDSTILQTIIRQLLFIIQGKRDNMKSNALDICLLIYNIIGSNDYLQLMSYSLQPHQVNIMSEAMENHRTQKNKPMPLAEILKQRKIQTVCNPLNNVINWAP